MKIELIRSRRRTMSLQVRRDGSVVVRAPLYARKKEIRHFVESHQEWIGIQQSRMEAAETAYSEIVPLTERELEELREKARVDLNARAEKFAPLIGVSYTRIVIRHQKTKWGSCSSKGILNFNCLLMLAPETVRDYVVVHELCHRKHMNHSGTFWSEVEQVLPDYRDARLWLRDNGDELMRRNP